MNEDRWSADELEIIGAAEEVELSSYRPDGSARRGVTMWLVRVGSDLYVRSAGGPDRPWYRSALQSGRGRLRAGELVREVAFADTDEATHGDIDRAYHAKYDRYGPRIVGSVVGPAAHIVTIRLVPGGSDGSQ